jgi:ATP-dependent Clp protease ATP-binding subunit ClpA
MNKYMRVINPSLHSEDGRPIVDVYDVLMQAGYKPEYGAREMKRAIDRLITQPLGKALLEGKYKDGEAIQLIANNGKVAFN